MRGSVIVVWISQVTCICLRQGFRLQLCLRFDFKVWYLRLGKSQIQKDSLPALYNTWSIRSPCANNYSKKKIYVERKVGQLQVIVLNDLLLFRRIEESRFTAALSYLAKPNIWSRFWWSGGLRLGGLRPLSYCDRGFESLWGLGRSSCLFCVSCV